jgi:transposase InsO family protein
MVSFINFVENKFYRKLKALRSDNGGEYANESFQVFCKDRGIEYQDTVPYTPQQNGIAERKNRYLTEMTRCMLLDAKLENKYWGEAILAAN